MKKRGVLITILSGVLFGIVPLIVKVSYSSGYNALSVGIYRNLFAIPFLWSVCKVKKINLKVEKSDVSKILFIGVFGISATSLFLNMSYNYLPLGLSTTLHFMYPVFVTIIGIIVFKEKIFAGKMFCLLLSLLGMILIMELSNIVNFTGIVFAVLSGFTYAVYILFMEKSKLMEKYDAFVITLYLCLIGTIFFFCFSLVFNSFKIPNSLLDIVNLVSVAIVGQVLGSVLLQLGIKIIGSSSAAIFSVSEPLTSCVVGFVFLNEILTFQKILGCFFILFSVVIMANLTLKR